ncbi:MAG: hypothetical protein M1820_003476 [Bogoriella megaspora]|nr:MAG: hypothetical protein M1820_003476 [Bogoriella megaspora]
MQSTRGRVAHSARRVFVQNTRQQCRRYADHGHGHQTQGGNESLGRGFYITLASVPAFYFIYRFQTSDPDKKPYFTQLMEKYKDWRELWVERNDRHVKMIEQAAFDRNLFMNTKPSRNVELKYPEFLNQGSPWNVPAGHGSANIDAVIEHYQKKNFEENEKRLKAMLEGTNKAERTSAKEDKPNTAS